MAEHSSYPFFSTRRPIGLMLIVLSVLAIFAEGGVHLSLIDPNDAAATAANFAAQGPLFAFAFAAYLLAYAIDVPVAVLFHRLLSRVDGTVSLLAMAFRLVYAAIVIAVLLSFFAGVEILANPAYAGLGDPVRQGLALFWFNLFGAGFAMALVIFGFHLLILGWLLARSGEVPVWLGGLIGLGGASYLIDNLSVFVAPSLHVLGTPVFVALGMAELVLALWLVFVPAPRRPLP